MTFAGMNQSRKKAEPTHIVQYAHQYISIVDSLKGEVAYNNRGKWVITDTLATLNDLLQTTIRLRNISQRLIDIRLQEEKDRRSHLVKLTELKKKLDNLKIK